MNDLDIIKIILTCVLMTIFIMFHMTSKLITNLEYDYKNYD